MDQEQLVRHYASRDVIAFDLKQLVCMAWGNPQALLRRLPDDIEYIDISEHHSAFKTLFSSILQHDVILVREEYHVALQALQMDSQYLRGAYVTGQPGIGKTYFLIYALVHFLGERQPVALQPLDGTQVYLLFKDFDVTIHPITGGAPLHKCDFIWALSDSNSCVQIPPAIFLGDASHIRVIQATHPKVSCYQQWSKQHGATCYVMDIWTEKEVKNLAMLLRLDVKRMSALASKWGTTPQTLLQLIDKDDEIIKDDYGCLAKWAVISCQAMVDAALQLNLPTEDLSPIYFIQPRKTTTGIVKRQFSSITVPTQTIWELLLGKGLEGQHKQIQQNFYVALSEFTETHQP